MNEYLSAVWAVAAKSCNETTRKVTLQFQEHGLLYAEISPHSSESRRLSKKNSGKIMPRLWH
jgi:hypothetical protein